MLKSILSTLSVALLLSACNSTPQQATAPPPSPPAAQAPTYMVFFDWDRSNLSPQALSTINQAAAAYKSGGSARVSVVGHTDTSGAADYNMALSVRRANTVKDALVQAGVPASAIDATGVGESDLMVQTGDGVREPQNRRVVISGPTSQANMDVFKDKASYCKALSDKYRQYRTYQVSVPGAAALAQCDAGNYDAAIPTLEDELIRANIPLPAPGYRWPGRPITPS